MFEKRVMIMAVPVTQAARRLPFSYWDYFDGDFSFDDNVITHLTTFVMAVLR